MATVLSFVFRNIKPNATAAPGLVASTLTMEPCITCPEEFCEVLPPVGVFAVALLAPLLSPSPASPSPVTLTPYEESSSKRQGSGSSALHPSTPPVISEVNRSTLW